MIALVQQIEIVGLAAWAVLHLRSRHRHEDEERER